MKKKYFNGKNLLAFVLAVTLAVTSVPMSQVNAQEAEETTTEVESVSREETVQENSEQEETATEESQEATLEKDDSKENQEVTSEQSDLKDNQEAASEKDVSENKTEESVKEDASLQYVLIDKPSVTTPDTQNIVAGIGEGEQEISKAVLNYRNNTTGEKLQMEASKMVTGAVLFAIDFKDESQSGEYELVSVDYEVDGTSYTASMDKLNMDARFGVNCTVETKPDGYVDEGESGISAQSNLVGAATPSTQSADAQVSQDIVTFDKNGNTTSQSSLTEALTKAKSQNLVGAKKDLVVVIDPGHGGYDGGAQGNGLSEKNLNLSIAKYCKEELETYTGVKVYMTRSDDTFIALGDRTTLAKNWGADVFVSIHINSSTDAAANGAEVWYPNPTGSTDIHNEGANLAQKILDQLGALGLNKRGIHYRNYSYDWSVDQNVGDLDYYAVIRNAKANGFPGVIVEHAFVSNPSDAANYLGNEAALKKLGVADAKGIAAAYGLTKEPDYTAKDTTVTAKLNSSQTKATLTATGLSKASGVKFRVYSKENGKDDLKWYTAKKVNGVWTAKAKIANHKSAGKYYVSLYVVRSSGEKYKVSSTSFKVSAPSISKVSISKVNKAKGTFQVRTVASAKAGVENVRVAVWRKDNQSDLKWYTAKLQSDGSYKANVHNKSFGDYYGTFHYSVQVTAKNGVSASSQTQNYKLSKSKVNWTIKNKSSYTKKQVTVNNVPYAESLKQVTFQVWSEAKGQGTTKTYTAKKNSDGSWTANVKIKDFKKGGKYHVTAYATLKSGKQKKVGTSSFTVTTASAKSVKVKSANAVNGTFKVVEDISSKTPVEKVEVVVWSRTDKTARYTYKASGGIDGKYTAKVNIKRHKYNYGKYSVYTYVTDKNGIRTRVDKRSVTLTKPTPTLSLTANSNNSRETVVVNNVPYGSRVRKVQYKVWNETNGQDDVKYYTATKKATGQYSYVIPLTNHADSGKIRIQVYAYYTDGGKEKLLSKKFNMPLYAIAGTSSTNAAQLVRYYKANQSYPSFYAGSDAPTIEALAQIYMEECNAEGIRAEVAFAQAMKETGFLRFSGRVPITAYNFAGMGAIDSDTSAYATYSSVREGVRAQVQHLKAYANSAALNNPCVDGRFGLVTRNTAPYVEWLGISENPYGKGWASAYRYGYSLRDDYIAKLLRY